MPPPAWASGSGARRRATSISPPAPSFRVGYLFPNPRHIVLDLGRGELLYRHGSCGPSSAISGKRARYICSAICFSSSSVSSPVSFTSVPHVGAEGSEVDFLPGFEVIGGVLFSFESDTNSLLFHDTLRGGRFRLRGRMGDGGGHHGLIPRHTRKPARMVQDEPG